MPGGWSCVAATIELVEAEAERLCGLLAVVRLLVIDINRLLLWIDQKEPDQTDENDDECDDVFGHVYTLFYITFEECCIESLWR